MFLKLHFSEKVSQIGESGNVYVFKVARTIEKAELKNHIEKHFGVKVLKVNIVNLPDKTKNFKRSAGIQKKPKKVVVWCDKKIDNLTA